MTANKRNPFLFAPAESSKPAAAGNPAPGAPEGEKHGEGDEGEGDEEEEEIEPEAEAAPEAAAEPLKMTATKRAGLHLKGRNFLINQIAAGYEEINSLNAENAQLRARVKNLEAAAAAGAGREKDLANKVTQAAAEQKTVSQEVRKELTSLGVTEKEAPAQLTPSQTPEGLLETFNGLKGAEKIAFFRTHEKALMAADAAAKKTK